MSVAFAATRIPRWEVPGDVSPRERLLVAAGDLLSDRRWSEISIVDVASHAGISRQTLYNEFGSRDEFAQFLVLREADQLLTSVERVMLDHPDDLRRAIAAGFEAFLVEAGDNLLVTAIVNGDDSDGLLRLITAGGRPVLTMATMRLNDFVVAQWPSLTADKLRPVTELIVRMAMSHASLPAASPSQAAGELAGLIGPHVDGLLAA